MEQMITGATPDKSSSSMRQLILAHRNLRELDAATIAAHSNRCIEYLDLSHNRITHLNWLYEFPHLKCLVMDDNRLREAHLEKLKMPLMQITTLTLNKNELSDLGATTRILKATFPNLQYLSLHGNPMCPDNLLLQPFSEFVPYEYAHYRRVLCNALPRLKFLDHFALESFQKCSQTFGQPSQKQHDDHTQVPTTHTDLWSKLKSFMLASDNGNRSSSTPPTECVGVRHYASIGPYAGIQSEGNRYITNSDL